MIVANAPERATLLGVLNEEERSNVIESIGMAYEDLADDDEVREVVFNPDNLPRGYDITSDEHLGEMEDSVIGQSRLPQ
jgi:hypothetical protein